MSVDYPSPWTGGVASVKGVGLPQPPTSVDPGDLPHKIPKIEGQKILINVCTCTCTCCTCVTFDLWLLNFVFLAQSLILLNLVAH